MKISLGTSQVSVELSCENFLQEWGPLGTDSLQSHTEIHEVFDTIVWMAQLYADVSFSCFNAGLFLMPFVF